MVDALEDTHVGIVIAEVVDDMSTNSPQNTICSVAVLWSFGSHGSGGPSSPPGFGASGNFPFGGGPILGPPCGQKMSGHLVQPGSRKHQPSHPRRPHNPLQPQKKQGSGKSPKISMTMLIGNGSFPPGQPGPHGRPIQPQPAVKLAEHLNAIHSYTYRNQGVCNPVFF